MSDEERKGMERAARIVETFPHKVWVLEEEKRIIQLLAQEIRTEASK